jgi:hypothetical protein
MFFQRIKRALKQRSEPLLLGFEIMHFLVDVIIVAEIVVRHAVPLLQSQGTTLS